MHALHALRPLVVAPALFLVACGDSGTTTTTGGQDTCDPAVTCKNGVDPAGQACDATHDCPTVKTECVGLVDNSAAATYAMRITHLTIERPSVLSDPVVKGLLDQGVAYNLPSCETASGFPLFPGMSNGAFSWILQFDTATNKLTTGGATPEANPYDGYCFVNKMVNGFDIHPLVVDAPVGADGKFTITTPQDVVVPVYSDVMATSVILLPLRQVSIHDATISDNHNCIGKFNAEGLDTGNLCLPSSDTPNFIDGATLDGFAVLEDADKVMVDQIGKSLCVILSGDNGCTQYCDAAKKNCLRDAGNKIVFKGDWCSTTNAAADATCFDAVRLSGKFSASSVAMKATCP